MASSRTLVTDSFRYGEGPRWHQGRLWFSDILAGHVLSVDEHGVVTREAELFRPSGLGWLPDGRLLVTNLLLGEARLRRLDPEGFTDVLAFEEGVGFNDMVVGPDGTAYLDCRGRPGVADEILMVRPDGSWCSVAQGLKSPNGLAISGDRRTLVVSETAGNLILKFSINDDGTLEDQQVFAADVIGADGLCLDAEGNVWVGSYSTGKFLHIADGGTVLDEISVPHPRWAVAPVLGGPDRRTLYLISADTDPERWNHGDSLGALESVRVDIPGDGWP
jgi:sugar lactone lactonase YvrE